MPDQILKRDAQHLHQIPVCDMDFAFGRNRKYGLIQIIDQFPVTMLRPGDHFHEFLELPFGVRNRAGVLSRVVPMISPTLVPLCSRPHDANVQRKIALLEFYGDEELNRRGKGRAVPRSAIGAQLRRNAGIVIRSAQKKGGTG